MVATTTTTLAFGTYRQQSLLRTCDGAERRTKELLIPTYDSDSDHSDDAESQNGSLGSQPQNLKPSISGSISVDDSTATTATARSSSSSLGRVVLFDDAKNVVIEIPSHHMYTEEQKQRMFASRAEQQQVQKDAVDVARNAAKTGTLSADNSDLRGLEIFLPANKQRMHRTKITKRALLENQAHSIWRLATSSLAASSFLSSEYKKHSTKAAHVAYLRAVVDQHDVCSSRRSAAPSAIVMNR